MTAASQSARHRPPLNMNAKIIVLLGLVALAAAGSFESGSFESGEAKYNFQWAVDHDPSDNHFGHQEARDGDNTQGRYYVQLPDGRLQEVTYHVDGDDGYVADVKYTGSAEFDSFESGSNESK